MGRRREKVHVGDAKCLWELEELEVMELRGFHVGCDPWSPGYELGSEQQLEAQDRELFCYKHHADLTWLASKFSRTIFVP